MQIAKALIGLFLILSTIAFFWYKVKKEKWSQEANILDLRAKRMAKNSHVESFLVKELKQVENKAHELKYIKLVDAEKYYQASTIMLVILGASLGFLEIIDLIF